MWSNICGRDTGGWCVITKSLGGHWTDWLSRLWSDRIGKSDRGWDFTRKFNGRFLRFNRRRSRMRGRARFDICSGNSSMRGCFQNRCLGRGGNGDFLGGRCLNGSFIIIRKWCRSINDSDSGRTSFSCSYYRLATSWSDCCRTRDRQCTRWKECGGWRPFW